MRECVLGYERHQRFEQCFKARGPARIMGQRGQPNEVFCDQAM